MTFYLEDVPRLYHGHPASPNQEQGRTFFIGAQIQMYPDEDGCRGRTCALAQPIIARRLAELAATIGCVDELREILSGMVEEAEGALLSGTFGRDDERLDSHGRAAEQHGKSDRTLAPGGLHGLPPVLTAEDVAAFLCVDRKTIYTAISEGQLPGRRVGRRRVVVLRDALLSWLRSNEPVLPSRRRSR